MFSVPSPSLSLWLKGRGLLSWSRWMCEPKRYSDLPFIVHASDILLKIFSYTVLNNWYLCCFLNFCWMTLRIITMRIIYFWRFLIVFVLYIVLYFHLTKGRSKLLRTLWNTYELLMFQKRIFFQAKWTIAFSTPSFSNASTFPHLVFFRDRRCFTLGNC